MVFLYIIKSETDDNFVIKKSEIELVDIKNSSDYLYFPCRQVDRCLDFILEIIGKHNYSYSDAKILLFNICKLSIPSLMDIDI